MKQLIMTAILSTCCFSLAACETTREAAPLRPDLDNPERLECEGVTRDAAGDVIRPDRGEPYVIGWDDVASVAQAKVEHDRYVARERERNLVVTDYVLTIEGRLFLCSSNMQWWRDYWSRLPEPAE